MIDASHAKIHPHAAGAKGGNEAIGLTKGGQNTKIPLAVDAHGMPVKVLISAGNVADCTQACDLIDGIKAENLIADRGYDSNEILEASIQADMQAVIPPKKNRKTKRAYDRHIYRIRHLVENAFLHLKQWRGVATRYAKKASSFLAIVQIRCLSLWLAIS